MPTRLALVTATVIALAVACPTAPAQTERRELAHRLRAFEQAYDDGTAGERRRARQAVGPASLRFLALRFADAGAALDAGRAALKPPTALESLAMSLAVGQDARLVERGSVENLTLTVRALYAAPEGAADPRQVLVRALDPATGRRGPDSPLHPLPARLRVPAGPGDVGAGGAGAKLAVELCLPGEPAEERAVLCQAMRFEQVDGLRPRLNALAGAVNAASPGIERSTLAEWVARLESLAANEPAEGEVDAAALLGRAEDVAGSLRLGRPYFSADRPGDVTLGVPYGRGGEAVARVRVPLAAPPPAGWPVLLLLHGAGGSENLFFEGYGAGCVATGGGKLGYFVVATRAGLFGPPPARELLAELAKRYPLDLGRVDLVGHSLGVAHALSIAQKPGFAVRRMALLAGTGQVSKPERLAGIGTFVGVGEDDFARKGAAALGDELARHLSADKLARKLYERGEHLTIVRQACDDVLGFLAAPPAAPGPK